jgi:hypothetical protein
MWSFSFSFSDQTCAFLFSTIRAHSHWFYHLNNIWREVQIINLLIMQFSLVSCYFMPLKSKYFPQCRILESPYSVFSLNVTDGVLQLHISTVKIIVLHILSFTFLYCRREDNRLFNITEICILPTKCICVFHVVLTRNSDCFPKQHWLAGLCSGDVMCFLWGTNWIYTYYLLYTI